VKIVGVYGKKDLDRIIVNGKSVSTIMDDFFRLFPSYYRRNYDKNLKTLKIFKVDESYNNNAGEYSDTHNVIIIKKFFDLIHELIHMSGRNYKTTCNSFIRSKEEFLFEVALVEGFTEYLRTLAMGDKPTSYYFEFFTASMLSNIDNIFEPYFVSGYDKFISLFPNEKDILSLMYALSFYQSNMDLIDENDEYSDYYIGKVRQSIADVIDNLIDIQLSLKMGNNKNKEYADKFMCLISDSYLSCYLKYVWDSYLDYANKEVNRRILRR
jgi:hypothetical protein